LIRRFDLLNRTDELRAPPSVLIDCAVVNSGSNYDEETWRVRSLTTDDINAANVVY
jgi:hypothetical protein